MNVFDLYPFHYVLVTVSRALFKIKIEFKLIFLLCSEASMPPLEQFLFHTPGLGLSVYIFNKLTRMIFVSYLFLYLNSCIVSLTWYISNSFSLLFRASSSIFFKYIFVTLYFNFLNKGQILIVKEEMARIIKLIIFSKYNFFKIRKWIFFSRDLLACEAQIDCFLPPTNSMKYVKHSIKYGLPAYLQNAKCVLR